MRKKKVIKKRYGVVHGYWWGPDTHLAEEHNQLVLDRVWAMLFSYDRIVLVHGYGPLDGRTLAEIQCDWLVENGFPKEKLLIPGDFGITDFPPRDTWEEVAVAKDLIQRDGSDPKKVSVDVVCMRWHATRIRIIYWWAGVSCRKLIRVDGPHEPMRFIHECVGLLMAILDPRGQNPLLVYARRKRKEEILARPQFQKSGK